MEISYSFHLSSGEHTISTKQQLAGVQAHNNRTFKKNPKDEKLVINIFGSDNIIRDVERIYKEEFSSAVEEWNSRQTKKDRIINNYMDTVSNDKKKSVAEEIIIGFGTYEFWKGKSFNQDQMTEVFKNQLKEFQNGYPNFKVANATVHFDEEGSPHMHIVGVPVKYNASRGMKTQVGKMAVFTKSNLEMGQDVLRQEFIKDIKAVKIIAENENNIAPALVLKAKEKGRNKNLPKWAVIEINKEWEKIAIANEAIQKTLSKPHLKAMKKLFEFNQLEITNEHLVKQVEELSEENLRLKKSYKKDIKSIEDNLNKNHKKEISELNKNHKKELDRKDEDINYYMQFIPEAPSRIANTGIGSREIAKNVDNDDGMDI